MPNLTVAANARQLTARLVRAFDRLNNFAVAFAARAFRYSVIARFDAQWVGVFAGCERERMPESVLGFRRILRNETRWCVAIVARCHRPVARFNPRVVMLLHDVAIRARLRIVGEIGAAFGVDKRVTSHSSRQAHRNPDRRTFDYPSLHGRPATQHKSKRTGFQDDRKF